MGFRAHPAPNPLPKRLGAGPGYPWNRRFPVSFARHPCPGKRIPLLSLARFIFTGSILAVFLSCAGNAAPRDSPRFLTVRDADTGRLYGRWPLGETPPGETGAVREAAPRFSIEFIHSVNNSPVRETFAVNRDGGISAVEARFYSFGAGMPSGLEEGLTLSRDGDALVLSGFADTGPGRRELNYIVGTVSDHLLYINDETISLRDLCGRNAHIRIQITGGE